ncbi:MAG: phosphate acyltransferase PlsX [Chlamydiae bacterium]|nr:phosphate acyltransferase PlsX [Chlamydiota bacterium]
MRNLSNQNKPSEFLPRIGIDLLGSDISFSKLIDTVLLAHEKLSHRAEFLIFTTKDLVPENFPSTIKVILVDECINMDDSPLTVLRKKKNSSIGKGIRMMKEDLIDVFISSGNSGAIVAAAKTILKTIKGINKVAFMTLIPAKDKRVAVLDVGANVKHKPQDMLQFAHMGIAYQKTLGIREPTVGLLNIGSEAIKGTPEHRAAHLMLQKLNNNTPHKVFIGNIEGRDVFQGPVDVLVTDGFTGNVFLKTSEGMASFLLDQIYTEMKHSSLCTPKLLEALADYEKKLDYSEYPGAILCGVKGLVIKFHGSSHPKALLKSIEAAIQLYEQDFIEKISTELFR